MQFSEVTHFLLLDKKLIGYRGMDVEGKYVDVESGLIRGIKKETLRLYQATNLFEKDGLLVSEDEIKANHFAYDGSNDPELVSGLQKRLLQDQAQMEEDAKSSRFNVVVQLALDGVITKMAGFVFAENQNEAVNVAKAYCMERYNCDLYSFHEFKTTQITPIRVKTRMDVGAKLACINTETYDKYYKNQ